METLKISKCSLSLKTITSMSGAVIVPDLSANQVAVKALKKFTAVNGLTKSVLQCDGHSELLALQEQVGRGMSLPTQVSPPYSHQSQGTVERFQKTLYGQVRAIRIGLADQLGLHSDQVEGSLLPWIVQHAVFQINRYLIRSDGRTSFEKAFNKPQKVTHCSIQGACSCPHSGSASGSKIADQIRPSKIIWTTVRQGPCHRHGHSQTHR